MRAEFNELAEKINNWGRWGAEDERGTLNFVTPEVVKAAAGLGPHGKTFSLAIPLSADGPQIGMIPGRINPLKTMLMINDPMTGNIDEFCTSDDTVVMGLQAGTHWDSLAHATYSNRHLQRRPDRLAQHQGRRASAASTRSARWFPAGVLLDVARAKGVDRLEPGYALTAADLDAAAEFGKVTVRSGDIVLVRTGQIQLLHAGDKMAYTYPSPGFSMQTALWLHDHEVAAVANDTIVFECFPGRVRGPAAARPSAAPGRDGPLAGPELGPRSARRRLRRGRSVRLPADRHPGAVRRRARSTGGAGGGEVTAVAP